MPPEIAGRLADELQLDEAQRAQLRKIMEDRRSRFEQVHREARERFDAEQRELRAAIRALLRPDQVQRFDQFINRRP
jgi:Spy/CpxP family protein refolding chaperone